MASDPAAGGEIFSGGIFGLGNLETAAGSDNAVDTFTGRISGDTDQRKAKTPLQTEEATVRPFNPFDPVPVTQQTPGIFGSGLTPAVRNAQAQMPPPIVAAQPAPAVDQNGMPVGTVRRGFLGMPLPPQLSNDPTRDYANQLAYQREMASRIANSPLAPFTMPKEYEEAQKTLLQLDQKAVELQKTFHDVQTARDAGAASGVDPVYIATKGMNLNQQDIFNWHAQNYANGSASSEAFLKGQGEQGKTALEQNQAAHMASLGNRNPMLQDVITQLDAAGDSDNHYKSVLDSLNKKYEGQGGVNGILSSYMPGVVAPDNAKAWGVRSNAANAALNQASQKVSRYNYDQQSLGGLTRPMNKDERETNDQTPAAMGPSGKAPGGVPVWMPDNQPGYQFPPGSNKLENYSRPDGVQPRDGSKPWGGGPAAIAQAQKDLKENEVANNRVTNVVTAEHFDEEASKDETFKSAAGVDFIQMQMASLERNLVPGSHGSGNVGTVKVLDRNYGVAGEGLNELKKLGNEIQQFRAKGLSDQEIYKKISSRLTDASIRGIRAVAKFNLDTAKHDAADAVRGMVDTWGRNGVVLDKVLPKSLATDPRVVGPAMAGWRNQVEENANHPSVNIGNQRVNLAPTSKYPGAAPAQQLPKDQEIQKIIDAGAAADFVAKTPVPDNPPPKVPVTSQQPTATPSIFGRAFDALTAPQTPPAPQTPTAPQTPSLTTPMRAGLPAPQAPSASQTPPTAPAGPAATPGQRSDGSPLGSMIKPASMQPQQLDRYANTLIHIESGGQTGQQTGSYKGLGQFSDSEMKRHGITNPDDRGQVTAAVKQDYITNKPQIEMRTGVEPTDAQVYLAHQQGVGGVIAHMNNPDGLAWQNMMSTAEGRQKGEAWAKQAVWGNIPTQDKAILQARGINANNITSRDFMNLWQADFDHIARRFGGDAKGDTAKFGNGHTAATSAGPAQAPAPAGGGFLSNVRQFADRYLMAGVPQGQGPAASQEAFKTMAPAAPIVGGVAGSAAGSLVGPVGTVAGGGAGAAAGQAVQNYIEGKPLTEGTLEAGAYGAAGSVLPGARVIPGMVGRAVAGGAVGAGSEALKGGDTYDILTGAAGAAGGSLLGEGGIRAVGLAAGPVANKIFSKFTTGTQQDLIQSANKIAELTDTVEKGPPKGVAGQPASEAEKMRYQAAKDELEEHRQKIADHGLDPDHFVQGVDNVREAIANAPVQREKVRLGQIYEDIKTGAGQTAAERGVVPPNQRQIMQGPTSMVEGPNSLVGKPTNQGGVDPEFAGRAASAERNLQAPAANAEDWYQNFFREHSNLEREWREASYGPNKDSNKATNLRNLADNVFDRQKDVIRQIYGDKAQPIIDRLQTNHDNYRNLMAAIKPTESNPNGDIIKAMAQGGTEGAKATALFKKLAGDDIGAQQVAYALVRAEKVGAAGEKSGNFFMRHSKVAMMGVLHAVGFGALPGGHIMSAILADHGHQMLNQWAVNKAAGGPITMKQMMQSRFQQAVANVRNNAGMAGARTGAQFGQTAEPMNWF